MGAEWVVTSRLTSVEVASAVWRQVREGWLSAHQAEGMVARLFAEIESALVVEFAAEVTRMAAELICRHPLRAGDAVQLASALFFRTGVPGPMEFIAFDARLNAAARAEGLPTPAANL